MTEKFERRTRSEKPDLVELGKNEGHQVSLNLTAAINGHVAISGTSGVGKSVAGQKLLRNLVAEGGTAVAFDMHRLFANENILPELRDDLKVLGHEVDVYNEGIRLALFEPLQYVDGNREDTDDTVNALATTIAGPLRLGCQQKADLIRALSFVAREDIYEKRGIAALDEGLELVGSEVAANVRDKLRHILKRNVFRGGENFLHRECVNILRLSSFDLQTQELIAELVLAHLWRWAQAGHFVDHPVWLFCDECQNLQFGGKGIVNQILQEGRKLGLNLILITPKTDRKMLTAMGQAGTQLFFSPSHADVPMIAKMLNAGAWKDYVWQLRSLRRGQCFVLGALEVDGNLIRHPLSLEI